MFQRSCGRQKTKDKTRQIKPKKERKEMCCGTTSFLSLCARKSNKKI
jgi:hypothetical protein